MDSLSLLDLPYRDARALLASGVPVYLTVNPVEYHGPHLSLHNDRLLSIGLAQALHARIAARRPEWPFVRASDLEIGVEPCPGEGTRVTPFAQVRALILDAVRALEALGARRVVVMTFHGAPMHNLAIEAGLRYLRSRGIPAIAPFHLVLTALLELEDPWTYRDALETIADPAERETMARELVHDFHAGFFETSLALHFAPQSVSPMHVELPPCPPYAPDGAFTMASKLAARAGRTRLARELDFAAHGVGWGRSRPFLGYTGRPHLANAAAGEAFARHMLARAAVVLDVLEGRAEAPPPIMAWVEQASLGGLVPTSGT